ncbi:hypothetical protein [Allomuricauda sp. SCSIO 65647]|uniref:hypothetical protein n=1 Tax=Allomuricauda sp. SCSIO 65647 TaxID=2908843 RepID=UPI001F342B47|nr:hypothetical protein [Muricauda sp. SCSIO 65647]UJH68810.1 hypothetical protein L0P89_06225 [Muricauda sp. SCSIO 65647]
MRPIDEIISEIESYESDDGNWLRLDELVTELWESGNPENGIDAMFKIFENNPTDDGAGVFWSILHGLETLEYEQKLYDSLMEKPSHMTIAMLKRIENTESETIAGKSISELKDLIKNNPKTKTELLDEI